MRRSVFAWVGIVVGACTPNLVMDPIPLAIERGSTEAPVSSDLPPDAQLSRAENAALRVEEAYLSLRRSLRSTRPRRIQKGLVESVLADTMFSDRIALLEGEAHERLGDLEAAKSAFLRAINEAHAPAVAEQATRALVAVLAKTGDHALRLQYLDALIEAPPALTEKPDYDLHILRAETLHALKRKKEAQASLRKLMADHPDPRIAAKAEKALLSLIGRRKLSPADDRIKLLGQVRWMSRTGKQKQALQTLAKWRKKQRRVDAEVAFLEADLWRTRDRMKAEALLVSLTKKKDRGLRSGAMLRLARLSCDRFQYWKARLQYAKLIETFAGSADAIEAEFEAAQLEYDSDQYEVAAAKMRRFAERHPDSKQFPKASWLAGFSAHLAGSSSIAIASFEHLLAEQPDHTTAPRARYWLARELELVGEAGRAGEIYGALVDRAPLGFYRLLAEQRLQGMGVSAALNALPPVPTPKSVDEVVKLLGPDRPLGVDRAAALFAARLNREGVEELIGLAEYFRKIGDTQGATAVVDLFQIFGRNAWAFLLARNITEGDDPDDLADQPYYWRVWRHAFPTPFEDEVRLASQANTLDPFLVYSVMRTESRFRPEAVSPVGARGLMQLMPKTARWIGQKDRRARSHVKRYKEPDANIWLGAWYIRFLLDHYQGNVARALGAYNAGPAAMDRWGRRFGGLDLDEFIERIPYDETRAYVRRAMESYLVYQRLHPEPSVAQTEEPDGSRGS